MIDHDEADDKIIAVLANDAAYGAITDIQQVATPVLDRLRHYFQTYKQPPDVEAPTCEISQIYAREEAHEVIKLSLLDYQERFGDIEEILSSALGAAR